MNQISIFKNEFIMKLELFFLYKNVSPFKKIEKIIKYSNILLKNLPAVAKYIIYNKKIDLNLKYIIRIIKN